MANPHKRRYIEGMQNEQPAMSPLGAHLNWLASDSPEGAAASEELKADMVKAFTTPEGLKVLMLFEKSVLFAGAPNGSSDGALREMNALRNFILEIRRIVANG